MVERLQASSCEPEVRKISSVVEAMVESDASTGRTPRAVAIRIMQLVMVDLEFTKSWEGHHQVAAEFRPKRRFEN
jgi:hypothetical protein